VCVGDNALVCVRERCVCERERQREREEERQLEYYDVYDRDSM